MGIQPLLTLPVSVIKFPTESSLNEEGLYGSQLEGAGWARAQNPVSPLTFFRIQPESPVHGAWTALPTFKVGFLISINQV